MVRISKPKFFFLDFIEGRKPLLTIAIIAATALIIRLIALFFFSKSVYWRFLVNDEMVYHEWALNLFQGKAVNVSDFAPLPAYIMAAFYKILGPDPIFIRYLNVVLGSCTCIMVYLTTREITSPAMAALAGFIAALYKPFIFFSLTIHKTSLSLFLFATLTWLFLASFDLLKNSFKKSIPFLGALGLTVGLLMNIRSNAAVIIPVIIVCYSLKLLNSADKKKFLLANAAFLAGLFLALAPFIFRNYLLSGSLKLTPSGGFNFYLGNNIENPFPYYRPLPFITTDPSEQAIDFVIEASRRKDQKLSVKEASEFWVQKTLNDASEQPQIFAKKIIFKLLAIFNAYEHAENHHVQFISSYISFLSLPFLGICLVMPFGIAGMATTRSSDHKSLFLILVAAVYASTMVLFFMNIRLRLPLVLIFIPFMCKGFADTSQYLHDKKFNQILKYSTICLFSLILCFIPIPGKDNTSHMNTHANALISAGKEKEGLNLMKESMDKKLSFSVYANINLANYFMQNKNFNEALLCLQKIPDSSFAIAEKYDLIGDIYFISNQHSKAAESYNNSINARWGQIAVRKKLQNIYGLLKKPSLAAKESEMISYIESFHTKPQAKNP